MKNPLFFLFCLLIATFSLRGTAQTYCTSEAVDSSYENITNVTYEGINNTTTTHSGYNDFTSQVATVDPGGTTQMSVNINSDGNDYIFAFIDWNQNGVLDDAGEVYTIATATWSNGPHTVSINVPENARSGNTLMRVLLIWDDPTPNPCGTFNYGEVEDYTVNVTIPSCPAPSNLAASAITTTTVDLIWTEEGTATEWEVIYGIGISYPFNEGTISTVIDMDGMPGITIPGLRHSSIYTFYVKAVCDIQEESFLAGPFRVHTECSLAAVPWSENFDNGTLGNIVTNDFLCWSQEYETTPALDWKLVNSNEDGSILPRSGSLMAELRNEEYGETTKLITPSLDLSALNAPQLTFFFANANWGSDLDELRVYYKRSASDANWTLIPDAEYTTAHTDWEEVILLLPNAIGATDYVIAFEGTANYSRGINLDNISVEEVPTCLRPSALTVTEISDNAAKVSWTPEGLGTSWIVSWGAPGYTPGGANELGTGSSTNTFYQLTGLDPNTNYHIYVKSFCGVGDESLWRGPLSLRTICENTAATIPFLESFETGFQNQLVIDGCWSQESVAGTEVWVANSLIDLNRAPRTGNFNATLFQNNSDWLFYPVQLQAGINYELKFYARQYNNTGGTIEAAIGTSNNAAAMTTSIIAPSVVLNDNYQVFSGTFSPVTAGTYYFGIKATLDYNPQYISIDDISIDVYQPSPEYFVTTWTTTTENESITIPTRGFQAYSYSVDWEYNGVWESFTGAATHTYATPGTYTVAIRGTFPSIYFNDAGDKNKINSIEQWGTNVWRNMGKSFRGCSNLVNNATDTPNLFNVRSMNYMFEGASAFNGDLNSWNVSNIKAMNNVFKGASNFNGDISSWDVSNVTGMSQMFMYASAFNQDISTWDVGDVENMISMFENAFIFNQDISNWDVSNVISMDYMFTGASAFNQNLGGWNVSNVTNMAYMLENTGLSTPNYDNLLQGWSTKTLQYGVSFGAGTIPYCTAQAARSRIINDFGWNITDGGQNCGPCSGFTEYTTLEGWSNGFPDNTLMAIFKNDYNTSMGAIDACSIHIKPGVTVTVSEGTNIKAENDILIDGDLIFLSSATGNGELAAMGLTSTIIGNATVQRYMQNKRSYRMVSSAVTTQSSIHNNWQEAATPVNPNPNPGYGTHITGSSTGQHGFDPTLTGNYSMFTVDVANQTFEPVTNTDVNTLTAGNPYLLFVRGDRSIDLTDNEASSETVLRAKGSLVSGMQTQNFTSQNTGDFVMFGNPYQSVVDINTVFGNSSNLNAGHYFIYDPSLGDHGAYVTVNLPGGTNTSSSPANQFLQPGQAAQVATLTAGASSIVFNESDKAPGNFTSTNRPLSGSDMLTAQLYTSENFNNGGPVHDSFGILFSENNENALTPSDAVKPMNFYENMGINNNGIYLSLERREMPQAEEVYQLYTSGYQQAEYILKITVDGLAEYSLYLEDKFTRISTPLEVGDNTYSFSVDSNDALSIGTDRFVIWAAQRLEVNDNNLLSNIRLYPNPMNGNIFHINAPKLNGQQLDVSISDITGRKIYEKTLECLDNAITVSMGENIASGVYMVNLKYGENVNTIRLIKE